MSDIKVEVSESNQAYSANEDDYYLANNYQKKNLRNGQFEPNIAYKREFINNFLQNLLLFISFYYIYNCL